MRSGEGRGVRWRSGVSFFAHQLGECGFGAGEKPSKRPDTPALPTERPGYTDSKLFVPMQ
jgi:hypothetical protein